MADETFRPQKRSISQEEIEGDEVQHSDADNAAEQLARMSQMRQSAAAEVNKEFENPATEAGVKVSGRVPDSF